MECTHKILSFECSPFVDQTEYSRPSEKTRKAAASLDVLPPASTFCAPLVLPGDDLAEDPDYPAQSLQEWLDDEDRNAVEPGRRTLYVVPPPTVDKGVAFAEAWSHVHADIVPPNVEDVGEYLRAFYHGMAVEVLPASTLRLTAWDSKSKAPRFVGLRTKAGECVRIRTRAAKDGVFARQLNLDDLLDTAISILPDDAFALLLLVPWDIYESPEDDFACGRAYGGSRVAVISTARYHPALDKRQNVPRTHAWPASHCASYIERCCAEDQPLKKKKKKNVNSSASGPLHAAVAAHSTLPSLEHPTKEALAALWLGRACRTASHELGHCLGIDHCVYYACVMQGTASLKEDARQPPFLCPVDLVKLLQATGASREQTYRALLAFCEKHKGGHLFDAFGAWLRAQLPLD
ncbi:hypothetical protein MIND_00840100 [Mycena indigotica]|uniref:Archaemetzincin-2 n=1 Tax=Mycena indigotica TaxID=2126181 RepID=A0A8H6W0V5_9AGAR|nr:uncharacterized protein MIND_00840100 [Mycena indigotica]KAF7298921.1 hypothetical protein MIND_00840100 [Mycena indigotica]